MIPCQPQSLQAELDLLSNNLCNTYWKINYRPTQHWQPNFHHASHAHIRVHNATRTNIDIDGANYFGYQKGRAILQKWSYQKK
jgi:hypothetical protein